MEQFFWTRIEPNYWPMEMHCQNQWLQCQLNPLKQRFLVNH